MTASGRLELAAAERLRTHTHGHPLHARTLLEELGADLLNTARGVSPAPGWLAAVIVAKVGALGSDAQGLLAAAAVLGPSCPLPVVTSVAGVPDALPALEASVGAGLLERLPGGTARFVHPLVRAAVYNDLSATRRARLHLAAAAVSEGVVAIGHRVAAAAGPDRLGRGARGTGFGGAGGGPPGRGRWPLRGRRPLVGDSADRDRCVLMGVEARSPGVTGPRPGPHGQRWKPAVTPHCAPTCWAASSTASVGPWRRRH